MAAQSAWRWRILAALGSAILLSGCSYFRSEETTRFTPSALAFWKSGADDGAPKRRAKIRFAGEVSNSRKEILEAKKREQIAAQLAAQSGVAPAHLHSSPPPGLQGPPIPPGPPYPHAIPPATAQLPAPPPITGRLPAVQQASYSEPRTVWR